MANLKGYLGVARVNFLLLAVTLVAAGAAASAYDGSFSISRTALALVALVALHAAVNSLNEASDMRRGLDLETNRTPFSGGSGTLPAGLLHYREAYVFGYSAAALGGIIGIWLLLRTGWQFLPIMLVGAIVVIGYTDILARSGVGEIAAGLGLGALPVIGTAMVQPGASVGPAAIAAAIPAFFMTFNLLLLNEFPDEDPDRRFGRRNLILMFGRKSAATIFALAAIATPISILGAVALRALPPIALLAVIPSAMVVPAIRWAFTRPQEPVPLPAMGGNVIWNLGTNTLMAIALGLAAWRGW